MLLKLHFYNSASFLSRKSIINLVKITSVKNFMFVFQVLLKASGDPRIQDSLGRTPLTLSSGLGHRHVLEILFADDRSVEALSVLDREGRSCLFYAAQGGHVEVCKALTSRGMLVQGKDGFTLILSNIPRATPIIKVAPY